MRFDKFFYSLFFFFLIPLNAQAVLNLELTQGMVSALPIAIVPFAGQERQSDAADNVAHVISSDLQNSGRFKLLPMSLMKQYPSTVQQVDFSQWKNVGVDNIVIGKVEPLSGGKFEVQFTLLDVFKGQDGKQTPSVISKSFTVDGQQLRRVAHHISDMIYEQLIGQRGVFSTRIAYVMVQSRGENRNYRLEVADSDGFSPQSILISPEPIMSPAWSHNARKLAYVSFENRRAEVYIADVASGQRQKVSHFPGINGAPAWSPDDKKLALVLSKDGAPKIYIYELGAKKLTQVTTGSSIDTEPNWSPDGKSILFTSDRSGGPQLYQVSLSNGQVERLTYSGPYNAKGSFTPDGKKVVMLHRADQGYTIAIQEMSSGAVELLTRSGRDESPSLAPNGSLVLYGNEYGVLGIVSTDGRVLLRLPARDGEVRSPAWSGFTS